MLKKIIALVILATVMVACTPVRSVSFREVETDNVRLQVPDFLEEIDPATDAGGVLRLSDLSEATFQEALVNLFVYEDFNQRDVEFNQDYCDQNFLLVSQYVGEDEYTGIEELDNQFIEETDEFPAYCDLTYKLINSDTDLYVHEQIHRQYLFLRGEDEVVLEVATTMSQFPDYLLDTLNSLELIEPEVVD